MSTTINARNLTTADETITLPTEIELREDGSAVALHADEGDYEYADLDQLISAYTLDAREVLREFDATPLRGGRDNVSGYNYQTYRVDGREVTVIVG